MRLLQELKNKPLCNDFHFIAIAILLFLISLKYNIIFILLLIYLVFIIKKTKYILIITFILLIIYIIYKIKTNAPNLETLDSYKLKVIDFKDDYIITKYNDIKIKVYTKDEIIPGDIINAKLEFFEIQEKQYENAFDYKEYLLIDGIYYQAKIINYEKVDSFFTLAKFRYNLNEYLKNNLSSYSYSIAVRCALGIKTDDTVDSYFSITGLSHILAISGMHLVILYTIISKLLYNFFNIYKSRYSVFIIFIYVLFIGIKPSSLRAFLFILIKELNKKGTIRYTSLDIYSISFTIMLLLNPLWIYSSSFILSYLVSLVFIFENDIIKTKSKILRIYYQYLLIYFITLPITISFNNKISLIQIIISPLLSSILSQVLIPASYLVILIPKLDIILSYLFSFIVKIISFISTNTNTFNVPSLNFYQSFIYFIIFIALIYFITVNRHKIKTTFFFILYTLIIFSTRYLNPYYKITFISVGQGDSAIIEYPKSEKIVVIDTFNSLDYLLSIGINKIDHLIISHSDKDHIGGISDYYANFTVLNTYYPAYDNLCMDYVKNTSYGLKAGDSFMCGGIKYEALGPVNEYQDANSNSLVIKTTIDTYSFLFCGDMTTKEEEDIINKYPKKLDIDILKVAHHGSVTSSSDSFLSYTSPKYSIVSVGKNNYYNLPDEEIIKKLEKISKVYQTSTSGNINIYIKDKKIEIKTKR